MVLGWIVTLRLSGSKAGEEHESDDSKVSGNGGPSTSFVDLSERQKWRRTGAGKTKLNSEGHLDSAKVVQFFCRQIVKRSHRKNAQGISVDSSRADPKVQPESDDGRSHSRPPNFFRSVYFYAKVFYLRTKKKRNQDISSGGPATLKDFSCPR